MSNRTPHRPNRDQERRDLDTTTIRVFLGLAIFVAGLVGLVVVIGLLQRRLDPTGVGTMLGGLMTGLVTSVVLLNKKGGEGDGDK